MRVCVDQSFVLSSHQYCAFTNTVSMVSETQRDSVRRSWPAWASSFSRNWRLPRSDAEGKHHRGPRASEKGPSQPHRPLLTPSTATHSRVQPSGLASAPTGWFTSPAYQRAAFTVGPWNALVREVEFGGGGGVGEPSRFRERRHNDGDISFPALRRSVSFHQHLYFILSSLGKLRLGLRHKHKPQISRRWMMSSHAAYIHMRNIKRDL